AVRRHRHAIAASVVVALLPDGTAGVEIDRGQPPRGADKQPPGLLVGGDPPHRFHIVTIDERRPPRDALHQTMAGGDVEDEYADRAIAGLLARRRRDVQIAMS